MPKLTALSPAKSGPASKGSTRFPLSKWFDGSAYSLIRGKEFTATAFSFQQYLYKMAKERGIAISIRRLSDKELQVQAVLSKKSLKSRAKKTS